MAKKEALRLRLARTKTVEELEEMIHQLSNDPESKIGAVGLAIYNKNVMKKLDEITWAIYYIRKKERPEYVPKTPSPERKFW